MSLYEQIISDDGNNVLVETGGTVRNNPRPYEWVNDLPGDDKPNST